MFIKFPKDYCVYDFETTGLDTSTCHILEIGAKRVAGGEEEIKSWLIKIPGIENSPFAVPGVITEITGITTEMCEKDGVDIKKALTEFVEFVDGLPLIGHNISRYDNKILCRDIEKHGINPVGQTISREWIDTAALFKGMKLKEEQSWHENHQAFADRILEIRAPIKYNLTVACQELGIDVSDLKAHRAAADVEMTDRIYKKLAL